MQVLIFQGSEYEKSNQTLVDQLFPVVFADIVDWFTIHGFENILNYYNNQLLDLLEVSYCGYNVMVNLKKSFSAFFKSDIFHVLWFGIIVIVCSYLFGLIYLSVTRGDIGFAESWNRWDAPHYLSIAQHGYQTIGDEANFIVFYPLFPFLTFLASGVFKNVFASSLIVSNIFYLLSIVYLYKLVLLDHDKKTAFRAVVLMSIFPTAYFFHAPYTESVFLFLSIMSFYQARKDNWLWASIFAAFACLSRVTGVILPIALLIEFFIQKNQTKNYYNLFYLPLIAVGPLIYFYINYSLFGNALHFMVVQKVHWYHSSMGSPIKNFIDTVRASSWLSHNDVFILSTTQSIFTFVAAIFSVVALFRVRLSYAIYSILSVVLITVPSFWMSNPRYVMMIFPITIILAVWSKSRIFYYLIVGIFVIMFLSFFTIYLTGPFAF